MTLRQFANKVKQHANINNGVLIIALLIAASWVWSTIEAIQRNFVLQQQVDSLKQEIALDELRNKTISFQNKYYATAEYIELSARERLNKASPDEKVLILPPNTKKADVTATNMQAATPITDRSNFDQWMYFLFGDK